jgi:LmbE family N-acetylglucosaminyl deacetylase
MKNALRIGAHDRLMVLVPHPDDESLAAGGLIQRALALGVALRVVFATDGEDNAWTQRIVERRLWIGPADRARFGLLRRAEAFAALACLGVDAGDALFLGFPDQGITDLLTLGDPEALAKLVSLIATWRPTLLIVPSSFDRHPDHSALGVLTRLAVARLDRGIAPRVLGYLVHVPGSMRVGSDTLELDLSAGERERKRSAILCHRTQVTVHRRKFLSFAAETERFEPGDVVTAAAPARIRFVAFDAGGLRLEIDTGARPGPFGPKTLLLTIDAESAGTRTLSVALRWRAGKAEIRHVGNGEAAGTARLERSRRGGLVTVPRDACLPAERIFAKLRCRPGFYDNAGWVDLSAARGEIPWATPAPLAKHMASVGPLL